MTTVEETAVRKSVTVAASPERAFELFTEGIGDWWPFRSHSIHGDAVETAVFEPRAGGSVYERTGDGREAHWATVLAFDPPRRFVLEWKVNPNAVAPTEVEVRFRPEGGGTRVDLEPRGWERLGDRAEAARSNYDTGWDVVLGEYVTGAQAGREA